MGSTAASQSEVIALVQDRYRGRGWPGCVLIDPQPDGTWTARPEKDLDNHDKHHFIAAVFQVRRMHPWLTD